LDQSANIAVNAFPNGLFNISPLNNSSLSASSNDSLSNIPLKSGSRDPPGFISNQFPVSASRNHPQINSPNFNSSNLSNQSLSSSSTSPPVNSLTGANSSTTSGQSCSQSFLPPPFKFPPNFSTPNQSNSLRVPPTNSTQTFSSNSYQIPGSHARPQNKSGLQFFFLQIFVLQFFFLQIMFLQFFFLQLFPPYYFLVAHFFQ
jgi:hypothetical protein